MMIGAALIAMATAGVPATVPPAIADFEQEATGWLLNGKTLPRDYRLRLLAMPPDTRLQAVVFLRRMGLLTGDPWTLDDLLRPATQVAP